MLKKVGRIRLSSERQRDPWTTSWDAHDASGAPLLVRIGKLPVTLDAASAARFDADAARAGERGGALLPVVEHGVSFSMPWVAHPALDGRPLGAWVAERGPLAKDVLATELLALVGADVAEALAAAHEGEPALVHGAVGLDTIWIDAEGARGRLVGVALARVCLEAGRAVPPLRVARAAFASPEQARDEPIGPASDVYSLAAALAARGRRAGRRRSASRIARRATLPRARARGRSRACARRGPGGATEQVRALTAALRGFVGSRARRRGAPRAPPSGAPRRRRGLRRARTPLRSGSRSTR
ncbi:MAG: hypothetical protein KF729_20860 [Sandaracinaceae bacterium]|nr:hypothetical protein [Sandaracinaceae bacterium]